MNSRFLLCALIAALFLPGARAAASPPCPGQDFASPGSIEIKKTGKTAQLQYHFAHPISCLDLAPAGKVRTLTWHLHDPGAILSEDGDQIRLASAQSQITVDIKALQYDGQIDRIYSPLIAFDDDSAIAVYTRYLRIANPQQPKLIKFDGYLPSGGTGKSGQQIRTDWTHETYLLIGRPAIIQRANMTLIVDESLPHWISAQVQDSLLAGTAHLQTVAPLPGHLTYLLTYSDAAQAKLQWRGDTLHELIRLNFMGNGWNREDAERGVEIKRFVMHELFHTVNQHIKTSIPGDGGISLLEGGAEAAAATILRRVGTLSADQFTEQKNQALLRCLALPGEGLNDKEKLNTRLAPYACGALMQFLSAALLETQANGTDVLDVWSTLLRAHPNYDWDNFFSSLRLASKAQNWHLLAQLEQLVRGKASWSSVLAAFSDSGLLHPLSEAEQHEERHSIFLAQQLLAQLLDEHCKAMRGTYLRDGLLTLDAPASSCHGLPDKFTVAAVNGQTLRVNGREAFLSYRQRCANLGTVELTDDRGNTAIAACKTARPLPELYRF